MREITNKRLAHKNKGAEDGLDKTLVRIILQAGNPEIQQEFIRSITDNHAPDIQVKIYVFVKALICSWAGDPNLSCEDAAVIEDCRKICDVMGWMPAGV